MNVLVLNATYEALNITRWQRALVLVFSGKAESLEDSGNFVHSANASLPLPSVIRMVYHVRKPRLTVPFSRSNLFLRDRHTCQYCGESNSVYELTLDHVLPRSRGGETCWENVVTACKSCNSNKGDRLPENAGLSLLKKPRAPHYFLAAGYNFREEWGKYIPYAAPAAQGVRH